MVGAGYLCPDEATAGLLTALALSSYAGAAAVFGVAPALHSPLMAVTNAISGPTFTADTTPPPDKEREGKHVKDVRICLEGGVSRIVHAFATDGRLEGTM
jgi:hypothetical protein